MSPGYGSVTPIIAGQGLPNSRYDQVIAPNGALFGLGGHALLMIATNGQPAIIDESASWERILGSGQYAFVYGASKLQRLDMQSGVFETTNLLGNFGLLSLSDMSFSSPTLLRLDGTASSGAPVAAYIDLTTGVLTTEVEDLPRFSDVVPLE